MPTANFFPTDGRTEPFLLAPPPSFCPKTKERKKGETDRPTDGDRGRFRNTTSPPSHARTKPHLFFCASSGSSERTETEVDTSVVRILIGFPIPISQGKIQCPSFQLMISNFSSLISHFQFLISHSLFLPSHFQLLVSHFM